jgi:hypothetical protein
MGIASGNQKWIKIGYDKHAIQNLGMLWEQPDESMQKRK